ncbi:MAG TPA: hypothetical protein VFH27_06405 [Longimicrobiaceae bacterium]|nr:hypothetical protein [Longimicrobiaceae bacterium]
MMINAPPAPSLVLHPAIHGEAGTRLSAAVREFSCLVSLEKRLRRGATFRRESRSAERVAR